MKSLTVRRWQFDGMLYIPKVDTNSMAGDIIPTYEKDIVFDFSGSASAPRSVVVAAEPFPTLSLIKRIRNKYQEELMPTAEFTVTGVEVILDMFGRVDGYKHLVALSAPPDFGYEITR